MGHNNICSETTRFVVDRLGAGAREGCLNDVQKGGGGEVSAAASEIQLASRAGLMNRYSRYIYNSG